MSGQGHTRLPLVLIAANASAEWARRSRDDAGEWGPKRPEKLMCSWRR